MCKVGCQKKRSRQRIYVTNARNKCRQFANRTFSVRLRLAIVQSPSANICNFAIWRRLVKCRPCRSTGAVMRKHKHIWAYTGHHGNNPSLNIFQLTYRQFRQLCFDDAGQRVIPRHRGEILSQSRLITMRFLWRVGGQGFGSCWPFHGWFSCCRTIARNMRTHRDKNATLARWKPSKN